MPEKLGQPAGALLWLKNAKKQADLISPYAEFPVITIDPFTSNGLHISRYYCLTVQRCLSIKYPDDITDLFPARILKGQRESLVLIHPGSGSMQKNFSPAFYQGLKSILITHGFKKIMFILGPAENTMLSKYFSAEDIIQPVTVLELSEWLARSSFYIGNDSGVSHLAGFLGVPAFIFYRTTDPAIWGVLGKKVYHIKSDDEMIARQLFKDYFTHSDLTGK